MKDGTEVASATASAGNGWAYSIEVDKNDASGNAITYTVAASAANYTFTESTSGFTAAASSGT